MFLRGSAVNVGIESADRKTVFQIKFTGGNVVVLRDSINTVVAVGGRDFFCFFDQKTGDASIAVVAVYFQIVQVNVSEVGSLQNGKSDTVVIVVSAQKEERVVVIIYSSSGKHSSDRISSGKD